MDVLAQVVVWLNAVANALGKLVLAPVGELPGWLSATLAAAGSGLLFLVAFKCTSNQRAIKAVRSDIKAHLLALKLFKDSAAVALRAQGRILLGALRLLALAVVPLLVMAVPVTLVLGQLSLWYQARPLRVGEETVITLKLNGDAESPWPDVSLQPTEAVEVLIGPVRVLSKREVCWSVRARESGYHRLVFQVGGPADKADSVSSSGGQPPLRVEKELAVGDGFMRVSTHRPGWEWSEAVLHPAEEPFGPDSPVRSIEIEYPQRSSWTSGTDSWVIYWFVVSLVAALCFRRLLGVNL
jgi:hypothetical protein